MFYTTGFIISLIYFACTTANECRDESILCNITSIDVCSNDEISQYCLKTCHLCDRNDSISSTSFPSEECSDQWTNCTKFDNSICQIDSNIARIYCYKTCTNCTTTIISTTIKPNVATYYNHWFTIIHCIIHFITMKFIV
ncbi:hypothetical protein LOAG_09642 [Loa loa]|uniref:ShKT domain-containing protein n=1 Tax=Loa loa TaxID=7209 RepID=A0A1S0TT33_LOALO|nr:hypothetical protein LOAG_09642 [Loa loa]EFO18853.2 hypothetical protein LOAG_09642 [Loa loa]